MMRFLPLALVLVLLAGAAAQATGGAIGPLRKEQARVLASGSCSSVKDPRCVVARDAAALLQMWRDSGASGEPPAIDFAKEMVVGAFLGDGPREPIEVHEVLTAAAGTVLRAKGRYGEATSAARFVLVALPVRAGGVRVEDADWTWRYWRIVAATKDAAAVAPSGVPAPWRLPKAPLREEKWFDDAVSFRAFWRQQETAAPPPDVDFRTAIVFGESVPRSFDTARLRLEVLRGWHGVIGRLYVEDGAEIEPSEDHAMCLWPLPRIEGRAVCEPAAVLLDSGVVVYSRSCHRFVDSPSLVPELPVLRVAEFDHCGAAARLCARATTPAEWRTLRDQLALPAPGLPDDWCDFAVDCVVVLATGPGRVWPGFDLAGAKEEDVDVLTVTQTASSGEDPGQRSPCIVLKLPRRPAQLSVVLRQACGPAPARETTLQTFAAMR